MFGELVDVHILAHGQGTRVCLLVASLPINTLEGLSGLRILYLCCMLETVVLRSVSDQPLTTYFLTLKGRGYFTNEQGGGHYGPHIYLSSSLWPPRLSQLVWERADFFRVLIVFKQKNIL